MPLRLVIQDYSTQIPDTATFLKAMYGLETQRHQRHLDLAWWLWKWHSRNGLSVDFLPTRTRIRRFWNNIAYVRHVTIIWSVCKWFRKKFTRSEKGLCRQSDECFENKDDLDTAAFACCNDVIPETAGTIIVSANVASKIIANDVLFILRFSSQ